MLAMKRREFIALVVAASRGEGVDKAATADISSSRAIGYFNGGRSAKYSEWAFSTSAMKAGRN
jgi:hypothetical protein